jgi:hypothetical protein
MSTFTGVVYFPATKDRPAEPAPYVLTEEDMVRLLRLETAADPYQTLYRYRNKGQLRATQVGKHVRFLLPDVVKFLATAQEENPR